MAGAVQVEQRDNVLVATLSNPPHALMDREIQEGLVALARRADEDPEVGAVVLTGAHPTRFIAHFDVSLILANARAVPAMSPQTINTSLKTIGTALKVPGAGQVISRSPAAGMAVMERIRGVNLAIEQCSAVWIAALHGDTGGGGELALACDFRFMADGESASRNRRSSWASRPGVVARSG